MGRSFSGFWAQKIQVCRDLKNRKIYFTLNKVDAQTESE